MRKLRDFLSRVDNVPPRRYVVGSVSMFGEPSAGGSGSALPAVVDDLEASSPRGAVVSTREQEFLAFVAASGRYLLRTAVLLCGDPVRAEELVQATYERTYRAWRVAHGRDPLRYARRVLVNLRVDGWRHTRREVVTDPSGLPEWAEPDNTAAVIARNTVVQALSLLPLAQRRVVVLRHLLDLTEAEVAHELDISVGTVKSHNARGIARLREIFVEGDLR
jgi:RNA polymerase sigma-70 factor (sigma-E family)